MASETFRVKNVKCGGCAANIRQGLGNLSGVSEVTVDVATGTVIVTAPVIDRAAIIERLTALNYPLD
jgi:copper chaperone